MSKNKNAVVFKNLGEFRDYLKVEVVKNPSGLFNVEMLKVVEKDLAEEAEKQVVTKRENKKQ